MKRRERHSHIYEVISKDKIVEDKLKTEKKKLFKKQTKKKKTNSIRKGGMYYFKRVVYYLLFFLFLVGSFLGIIGLRKQVMINIPTEADSFAKEYTRNLLSREESQESRDFRQKYLKDATIDFRDILDDEVKISSVNDIEVKNKKIICTDKKLNLYFYDYILLLNQCIQEKSGNLYSQKYGLKLQIAHDKDANSFVVNLVTPHDYKLNTNLSDNLKKQISDNIFKKDLSGEPLDQNEQEILKNQLKTFFSTYNESQNKAQSLVNKDVNLPHLYGKFELDSLQINGCGKDEKNNITKILVEVKYKQNKNTEFLKKYLFNIKEKTIILMEEL